MGGCFAANQTAAKAYYFVVFGLTVIITWVLRDYAAAGLKHVPQIKTCFDTQAILLLLSFRGILICDRLCQLDFHPQIGRRGGGGGTNMLYSTPTCPEEAHQKFVLPVSWPGAVAAV